jgi:tetratricopeptide (TPR) repeat protein
LLRSLGEAYKETGCFDQAMATLQRAIRANPGDGASLSMLGELYGRQNQGDEIALSLCQQAVELDDEPWIHWYRLGWIKLRLGDPAGTLEALRHGLRRSRGNKPMQALRKQAYEMQGRGRQRRDG